LNNEQSARVKEFNEQIKALSQHHEPDQSGHERRRQQIDDEINHLREQQDSRRNDISVKEMQITDFKKKHCPSLNGVRDFNIAIGELVDRRNQADAEMRELQNSRTTYFTKLRNARQRYRVASSEEATCRTENIDERIERETLSNVQLKKLLMERDRAEAGRKYFQEFDRDSQFENARDEDNRLRVELRDLSIKIRDLRAQQRAMEATSNDILAQLQVLEDEKNKLWCLMKDLKMQIDGKREEKKQLCAEFKKGWDEYCQIQDTIMNLQYEKSEIFAEAERLTMQALEGKRRIEETSETNNPNERKIRAATSLIGYLQAFLGKDNEKMNDLVKEKGSKEALAMIAELRKPSKKERQFVKKHKTTKAVTLAYDVEKLKQFDVIEVTAPMTIEQISATLQIVQDKVKDWTNSFIQTRLIIEVQPDDHCVA
jgi:chromosome segregation ATPase